jgi:hypothetical protein
VFCNSCGAEMQPTIRTCPRCGSVSGLIGGIRSIAVPETPTATALPTTVLYFGRLFAISKIAAGSVLALMLIFNAPLLTSFSKPESEVSAVVSLATGYGLLKRQMWGLYLLMAGFFFPILQVVMSAERHAPVHLLPFGIIWNLIGLWYFWEHRKALEG